MAEQLSADGAVETAFMYFEAAQANQANDEKNGQCERGCVGVAGFVDEVAVNAGADDDGELFQNIVKAEKSGGVMRGRQQLAVSGA